MTTFLIRYRWALMGTFILHIAMVIYMQTEKFPAPYIPINRVEEIPVILDEIPKVLTPDEKIILANNSTQKISNITANENDKVGETSKQYDAKSYKNLDQDVEKELRDYEKNAFNEFAANHKHSVDVNENENPTKIIDKKNDKNNAEDPSRVRNVGKVSGSYNLNGRRHENFAKPAYVCKGSGTIILNIKVNANGKVTSAEIDDTQSNYTEECMGINALQYAKKCKFEAGTKWGEPQSGTITYTYISQ